jgi:hypothetical protein
MLDRIARLAQERGRRMVVIAAILFAVAGVLGSGVADHLAPYGADDPDTESVEADELLQAAGYRETGLVVLIDETDVTTAAGKQRVAGLARELRAEPDVGTSSPRTATPPTSPSSSARPTTRRPRTRPSASPTPSPGSRGSR